MRSELYESVHGSQSPWLRQLAAEGCLAAQANPALYIACLLLAGGGVGWLLVLAQRASGPDRWWGGAGRALLLVVVMLLLRWPTFAPAAWHVDEDQMVAGALTLTVDPVFWRSVDGTTYGPLVCYPLLWPSLLGLPIDNATARLTGVLLEWLSLCLIWATARCLLPPGRRGWALIPVLPSLLAYALIVDKELAMYTSEKVPITLLILAGYLLARAWRGGGPGWAWGSIAATSLVPFAKLQGMPLALWIALSALLLAGRRHGLRGALGGVAAGLLMPALILGGVAALGLWETVWQAYILNNLAYVAGEDVTLGGLTLGLLRTAANQPALRAMAAALLLGGGILAAVRPGRRSWWRRQRALLAWAAVFVVVTAYTVLGAKRNFGHYLLWALWAGSWLNACVWVLIIRYWATRRRGAGVRRTRLAAAVTCLLVAVVALLGRPLPHPQIVEATEAQRLNSSDMGHAILAEVEPGIRMAVWGWATELYPQVGAAQGTLEAHTERQFVAGPQRDYYRQRYMRDLRERQPAIFVDAVAPENWGVQDRSRYGHESLPELGAYIAEHYELIYEDGHGRAYLRKSTAP